VGTFQAFRMAAMGGARAVGLQDKTGLVEVGRSADLVLFDLANSLSILPRTDILGYDTTNDTTRHDTTNDQRHAGAQVAVAGPAQQSGDGRVGARSPRRQQRQSGTHAPHAPHLRTTATRCTV
jgi:hypothetical protein